MWRRFSQENRCICAKIINAQCIWCCKMLSYLLLWFIPMYFPPLSWIPFFILQIGWFWFVCNFGVCFRELWSKLQLQYLHLLYFTAVRTGILMQDVALPAIRTFIKYLHSFDLSLETSPSLVLLKVSVEWSLILNFLKLFYFIMV